MKSNFKQNSRKNLSRLERRVNLEFKELDVFKKSNNKKAYSIKIKK